MGHNQITDIPDSVGRYSHLKSLNLSNNKIETCPKSLAKLTKLKELDLKGNIMKDKSFTRVINDDKLKIILEYIKKKGRESKEEEAVDTKRGKSKKESAQSSENLHRIVVEKYNEERNFRIIYLPEVREVRQYILCCVVKNCNFDSQKFKEFIKIQTKLHETLCDRRELATIATHDLDLIKTKTINYLVKPKDELKIVPLGKHAEISASKLLTDLKNEADAYRKSKKRDGLTGIFKYLNLVQGDQFACLQDLNGLVISLPPLTNCDSSKVINYKAAKSKSVSLIKLNFLLFADHRENVQRSNRSHQRN